MSEKTSVRGIHQLNRDERLQQTEEGQQELEEEEKSDKDKDDQETEEEHYAF